MIPTENKKTKSEILLVGFGNLAQIKNDFKKAFPGHRVFSAPTVSLGLAQTKAHNLIIQPVYLLPGIEYERLCKEAKGCGKRTIISSPLLNTPENIGTLARFLGEKYGEEPVLFAGHGSGHPVGGAVYTALARTFTKAGFTKAFVGVLEGRPGLDETLHAIQNSGFSEIILAPLTLSAGKHVREDIFGTESDSWQSRLLAAGISVIPVIRPLLEFPEVRISFLKLCQAALEEGENFLYIGS